MGPKVRGPVRCPLCWTGKRCLGPVKDRIRTGIMLLWHWRSAMWHGGAERGRAEIRLASDFSVTTRRTEDGGT
jgi:hypothetical protein